MVIGCLTHYYGDKLYNKATGRVFAKSALTSILMEPGLLICCLRETEAKHPERLIMDSEWTCSQPCYHISALPV